MRVDVILNDALAETIRAPQTCLGFDKSLLCGATKPLRRHFAILRNAFSCRVCQSQILLSLGVSLFCGATIPFRRRFGVPGDTLSFRVCCSQIELRGGEPLLGGAPGTASALLPSFAGRPVRIRRRCRGCRWLRRFPVRRRCGAVARRFRNSGRRPFRHDTAFPGVTGLRRFPDRRGTGVRGRRLCSLFRRGRFSLFQSRRSGAAQDDSRAMARTKTVFRTGIFTAEPPPLPV